MTTSQTFYCKSGDRRASAKAEWRDSAFVVLKGSTAKGYYPKVIPEDMRDAVVWDDRLNVFQFIRDYNYIAPSNAATFILGYSANGRKLWRDRHGKSMG